MTAPAGGPVPAIVLAAGVGRRFGADKRRHAIGGEPMVARTVARYAEVFQEVILVLRPGDEAIAELVAPWRPEITYARRAGEGMGSSLAAGVRAAGPREHVVIALADMPFVAAATLRRLCGMLGPGRIVRPMHRGAPGHPVGFAQVFLDDLKALRGDAGARDIIRAHPDTLVQWWAEDPGVVADIDVAPA